MKLYARQLAWLNGSPKKAGSKDKSSLTRLEIIQKEGREIDIPDVAVRYVVDWLNELGWGMSGGMGLVALSASEVYAWAMMNDLKLEPWEFKAIREGSRAYVSQVYSESEIAPFSKADEKPKLIGKFKSIASTLNKRPA